MSKRLLVISDPHAGHNAGLTHPDYWHDKKHPYGMHQRELWGFFDTALKMIGKVNMVVCDGDLIDGKGWRSGGVEQYTSDMDMQADMGAAIIDHVKANEAGLIYGTPYHTGDGEDWEKIAADRAKTPIAFVSGQEWLKFSNCVFDFKHKVGGSSIPHGRMTAIARAKLWNNIWSLDGKQPNADVLIRGHVHYHSFCGGPGWMAMTCPALQGFGSRYGVRQCEEEVHIGMIVFDVEKDGSYDWRPIIADLPQQTAKVTVR